MHRDCLVFGEFWCISLWFARRFASNGSMWQRGLLNLIDFEGWIHRDCLFYGVPMYFTMIRAEIRLEFGLSGIAGCLNWYVWRRWYIGIAINCRVPMYSFFGYIGIAYFCWIPMYPECMVFGTYIGNVRFRAFPMYCYFGFSRRYIGIEISIPIPMYGGSNPSWIYIGMG